MVIGNISIRFARVYLLWFKILGTLAEISYDVIIGFISFQVFLILLQLDCKTFDREICLLLFRLVDNLFLHYLYSSWTYNFLWIYLRWMGFFSNLLSSWVTFWGLVVIEGLAFGSSLSLLVFFQRSRSIKNKIILIDYW